MTHLPFDMQLKLWGYEMQGDIANDIALLAENHKGGMVNSPRGAWWDHTQAELDTVQRYIMGKEVPVPEHWALPAVVDLRMYRDKAFYDIVRDLDIKEPWE